MKILMVITSHDRLGDTGRKTGFWIEELAAPYYVFEEAAAEITLASPAGGRPPVGLGPLGTTTAVISAATTKIPAETRKARVSPATAAAATDDGVFGRCDVR